jgi:L-amino acid N-acyltransferase YncA
MLALMDYARGQGFERMESIVLRENRDMVGFARSLGFEVRPVAQEPTLMQVAKPLGLTDENARRQDALAR